MNPGYYRGNGVALPAMGATLEETPKFTTKEAAESVRIQFPAFASLMCESLTEDEALEKDATDQQRRKKRATTRRKK